MPRLPLYALAAGVWLAATVLVPLAGQAAGLAAQAPRPAPGAEPPSPAGPTGRSDEAAGAAGAAGRAPGESARLESGLAEAMRLVGEGRHAQAAERLAGIAQEFPQAAEVRYRLGLLRLRENRLDEAEAQLGAAVRLSPRSAPAWLGLAQVQLRQRRRADALESARRAMEHAAQDEPVRKALAMLHAQLARQYREEKDAPRAVEAWQDAMRLDPGEPGHVLEAAQVFLDHRTFEPAVLLLERAAARFPRHAEVLRFLGLAYYGGGDEERALEALLRVADLEPDAEASYASLETLLPAAGDRLPGIIGRLRGFTGRNTASPLGPFLLAQALAIAFPDPASAGQAEAEALLREAIRREPSFWPGHFELHKPALAREELSEAARLLETTVRLNPEHASAHYSLAQVYLRQGDHERVTRERKRHHEILARQRAEAEARRAASPRLSYKLADPSGKQPSR